MKEGQGGEGSHRDFNLRHGAVDLVLRKKKHFRVSFKVGFSKGKTGFASPRDLLWHNDVNPILLLDAVDRRSTFPD